MLSSAVRLSKNDKSIVEALKRPLAQLQQAATERKIIMQCLKTNFSAARTINEAKQARILIAETDRDVYKAESESAKAVSARLAESAQTKQGKITQLESERNELQ